MSESYDINMKIVTPLTNIGDIDRLLLYGASEFFLGYIPYEWLTDYFNFLPLNGRERMYANFSIHSSKSMKILSEMDISDKVFITFNGHYYNEKSYNLILEIINFLYGLNFKKYIVADINLVVLLKERYDDIQIAISGDMGVFNSLAIEYLMKYDINRIIFPRKTPIKEMGEIICKTKHFGLEYEAFILNELCFYSGAFCNTYHCDELLRICRLPKQLIDMSGNVIREENFNKRISNYSSNTDFDKYILGKSGCGICKIKQLKDIGITHLKLVGRGKDTNFLLKDLEVLKTLVLKCNSIGKREFETYVKEEIFRGHCPRDCYYVDL